MIAAVIADGLHTLPRVGPGDVETLTVYPSGEVWTDRGRSDVLRHLGDSPALYTMLRASARVAHVAVRVEVEHGYTPRATVHGEPLDKDTTEAVYRFLARVMLAARRVRQP